MCMGLTFTLSAGERSFVSLENFAFECLLTGCRFKPGELEPGKYTTHYLSHPCPQHLTHYESTINC